MNERKLTKSELAKREDIIMKMKKNKRALTQKYGKDAEAVMYGRATKLAKKQAEAMDQDRIKEMVKAALMNPVKEDQVEEGNAFIVAADAAKDAGKKEFEFPKGSGKMHPVKIKADIDEVDLDLKGGTEPDKDADVAGILGAEDVLGLEEDLDLGHQDNEPHMLKADLYRIGKYAMELYQMVDQFEDQGEVDFPHWWQSKIIKAKDALVGAKHYLDFEINEPQIDAMVDVAAEEDVIDETSAYEAGRKERDKKSVKEGVWALGSINDIKKAIQTMEMGLDMDDTELEQHLQDNDAYFYNVLGDDELHDSLGKAYDLSAMGNEDRAHNELSDAIGRAYDLLKMQVEKEQSSSKPYSTDIFNEVADKLAKQLKSK